MAAFLDTNILIYAYVLNTLNPFEKVMRAKALLAELIWDESLIVSAQVLNEFAANALRKGTPPLTSRKSL